MRWLVPLAVLHFGCGPTCQPSERVVESGERWSTSEHKVYRTSPLEGPFLPFEGATVLRVRHRLGISPQTPPHVLLSFSERPMQSGGGGAAFPAGNQVVISNVSADEVTIRNDSCASYFIQVTVEADIIPTNDAGTD